MKTQKKKASPKAGSAVSLSGSFEERDNELRGGKKGAGEQDRTNLRVQFGKGENQELARHQDARITAHEEDHLVSHPSNLVDRGKRRNTSEQQGDPSTSARMLRPTNNAGDDREILHGL